MNRIGIHESKQLCKFSNDKTQGDGIRHSLRERI